MTRDLSRAWDIRILNPHGLAICFFFPVKLVRITDGKLVPGGIKAEAEQLMLNIEAALARRGLATKHVVKCTVFLADMAEWGAFNEVYKKHFSKPYPARSALGANGLWANARVEMECIAGFPD